MTRLRSALALGLLAGLGCSSRVQPINVTVYTKACKFSDGTSSPNPTDGVDNYKLSVSAADLSSPVTLTVAAGGAAKLENIPAGQARVLTVLGYHGKPDSGGVVQAAGQSAPFDVPDPPDPANPLTVPVVLRPAGKFAGATVASKPDSCAELKVARAGHAATLLKDGRVLITGGFSIKSGPTGLDAQLDERNAWAFHGESEIFDPVTGAVSKAQDMVPGGDLAKPHASTERAFHSANLLPNGLVLVLGGETVAAGTINVPSLAGLYDPGADSWQFPAVGSGKRSRHAAVADGQGRILYLGGIDYDVTTSENAPFLVQGAYWLDPVAIQLKAADPGLTFAATDFAAGPWLNGQYIVAAGGVDADGGVLSGGPTVAFFKYDDSKGTYTQFNQGDLNGVSLVPSPGGVVAAAIGASGSSLDHLLIAGGFGDGEQPLNNVDNLFLDTNHPSGNGIPPAFGQADVLKSPRGELCAATLGDGRVLTAGGDSGGSTSKDAELYQLNPAGTLKQAGTAQLFSSRKFHTCTPLRDGSVAVIGGLSVEGGSARVLSSIEIYTPVPIK